MKDNLTILTTDEYLPLRDVVFNTLRQAILKGEMEPGERLMEIALANKLGVSRTPIREAIRKLELEGLVNMIPRKGAVVASISEKDMKDVLEVRVTLEELVVELAIKHITPEALKELKEAQANFERAVVSKDIVTIVDADVAFHDVIYNQTDNRRLINIISNLREQMYRYRLEYIKDARSHSILISEHNDIIHYIEIGDVERAKKAIHDHIANQERGIAKAIADSK
ncbi:MAG: GntR family transcriptional regulator [Lachnospiraceae bacterium]|nr:GntR family transcriptional regulator [Lachnospiraceae bacterium]